MNKLTPKTNLAALAQTIQKQCKLIHPSKLPELEQLLAFLQTRKVSAEGGDRELRSAAGATRSMLDHLGHVQKQANITDLETYLEGLYEDIKHKIPATEMILQVSSS